MRVAFVTKRKKKTVDVIYSGICNQCGQENRFEGRPTEEHDFSHVCDIEWRWSLLLYGKFLGCFKFAVVLGMFPPMLTRCLVTHGTFAMSYTCGNCMGCSKPRYRLAHESGKRFYIPIVSTLTFNNCVEQKKKDTNNMEKERNKSDSKITTTIKRRLAADIVRRMFAFFVPVCIVKWFGCD